MTLSSQFKLVEKFVLDNAPTIATAVGVAGTITTAVLSGQATYKAYIRVENANIEAERMNEPPLDKKEILREVWTLYIPPVVIGSLTIASIVSANRIGTKRAAALAAAYSLSEKTLAEYKEKVTEKLGEKKEQKVRDEIAQERVNKNPLSNEVVILGTGEVLCYDSWTGRYFMGDMEKIRKAENEINKQILDYGYASLSDFYDKIGLQPTAMSEELGWKYENMCAVQFSTVLSEDGRPCISIAYSTEPVRNYFRQH